MDKSTQTNEKPNWHISGAKAFLSAGGIAAVTGFLTWFSTMSYERGEQSTQLHHLTIKLAKLENVDEQRLAMKERADASERNLVAAREEIARLRTDLNSVQGRLSTAQASISKAEKCHYLESIARISESRYIEAANWAAPRTNGYSHPYYTERSANYERDRANLTACLTSSTN